MNKISPYSTQKMVFEHLLDVHQSIYQLSIYHQNKVSAMINVQIKRFEENTENKIYFLKFNFLVIVTEKKNILLRYLHQQWDKKVNKSIFFYC